MKFMKRQLLCGGEHKPNETSVGTALQKSCVHPSKRGTRTCSGCLWASGGRRHEQPVCPCNQHPSSRALRPGFPGAGVRDGDVASSHRRPALHRLCAGAYPPRRQYSRRIFPRSAQTNPASFLRFEPHFCRFAEAGPRLTNIKSLHTSNRVFCPVNDICGSPFPLCLMPLSCEHGPADLTRMMPQRNESDI